MSDSSRAGLALAALAAIVTVTAAWWALALWPVDPAGPEWLLRTRAVCFGSSATGLPNAGGWLLLIGQPLGMLTVLSTVWTAELRAGLSLAMARVGGQIVIGVTTAAIVTGLAGVVVRVSGAGGDDFSAGPSRDLAASLTRIDDAAPALALVDQRGETATLESLRGRPVIVTFAYAHCETVCPLIVADVLSAQLQLGERAPAVLIVTLDPWRDTPARLPSIASAWKLTPAARVLSGDPAIVERTLNAWRIPRIRNERTGDFSHPSLVYVINADGRITYVLNGGADAIVAAVKAL